MIAHFTQADSIISNAGNIKSYDRYAYVQNNPIKLTDPSGHLSCSAKNVAEGDCSNMTMQQAYEVHYGVFFGWELDY